MKFEIEIPGGIIYQVKHQNIISKNWTIHLSMLRRLRRNMLLCIEIEGLHWFPGGLKDFYCESPGQN